MANLRKLPLLVLAGGLLLLAAAPASRAQFGPDPLISATLDRDLGDVKAALVRGSNVNTRDRDARTALMHAAIIGAPQIARHLIRQDALLDLADAQGNTALMHAAEQGHSDILAMLVEAGTRIGAEDRQGVTALMKAARSGQEAAVRGLLQAGANPEATDFTGRTALDHAREGRRYAVVDLLRGTE